MRQAVSGAALLMLMLMLMLAACSKAPDGAADVGSAVSGASGVAFNYGYSLRVPSHRISAVQDAHARGCERLGPARCRITGLNYTVDDAGTVGASLAVRIAAPLARAFGRDAVALAEANDGALVGAEISGTEAAMVADGSAAEALDAVGERERLDRELARTDLPDAERAELRRQREAMRSTARAANAAASGVRAGVLMTPVSFAYAAGHGTGIRATLADAGASALASLAATLAAILWILAHLGPPLLLLLIAVALWRRWGERWWRRAFAPRAAAAPGDPI